MTTDDGLAGREATEVAAAQDEPPPRRRVVPRGLRSLGLAGAALTTLVAAAWGTARLPHPRPVPPLRAVTTAAARPAPLPSLAPVRVLARPPAVAAAPAPSAKPAAALTAAERRARRRAAAAADSAARVESLDRVLRRYSRDRALTRRIAAAVLREARRAGLDPSLVVAVLVAENNVLKPHARNATTSARGLMQVMPGWAGRLGCASSDLTDVDANICHGVRVLKQHLRDAGGDTHEGLRLYNGCRRVAGSRRCDVYPTRVLAHAERLERQIDASVKRRLARADSAAAQ